MKTLCAQTSKSKRLFWKLILVTHMEINLLTRSNLYLKMIFVTKMAMATSQYTQCHLLITKRLGI